MTFSGPASITPVMDENEIIDDLRRAGAEPVPADVERMHLARMSATTPAIGSKRFGRLAVAGAAIVGFLAGSTGFAMAGALPDPAQGAAHDVLSVVQVEVPDRGERRGNGPPDFILEDPCKGPPAWALEKRKPTEQEVADHEALRNSPECADADDGEGRPEGAGPPEGVGRPDGAGPPDGAGRPDHAGPPQEILDDPCKGPPAWALEKRKPTEQEVADHEALRNSPECADADDGDEGG